MDADEHGAQLRGAAGRVDLVQLDPVLVPDDRVLDEPLQRVDEPLIQRPEHEGRQVAAESLLHHPLARRRAQQDPEALVDVLHAGHHLHVAAAGGKRGREGPATTEEGGIAHLTSTLLPLISTFPLEESTLKSLALLSTMPSLSMVMELPCWSSSEIFSPSSSRRSLFLLAVSMKTDALSASTNPMVVPFLVTIPFFSFLSSGDPIASGAVFFEP